MKTNQALKSYFDHAATVDVHIEESFRFLLHDPHSISLIEKGNVDIFALNIQGESLFESFEEIDQLGLKTSPFMAELLEGTLIYLGNLKEGDLLFPFPFCSSYDSLRIIGVAIDRVKLKKASFRVFQEELHRNTPLMEEVIAETDDWIALMDSTLTVKQGGDSNTIPIAPKKRVKVVKGQTLERSKLGSLQEKHHVIWIQPSTGELAVELSSDQEKKFFPIKEAAPPFPLTYNCRLYCLENATVASFSLEDLVRENLFLWSILCYHQLVLQELLAALKMRERDEHALLKERSEFDQAILKDTLKNASEILEPQDRSQLIGSQDPLMRACELIGERSQIKFSPPLHTNKSSHIEERLTEICNASHVNFRKVFLAKGWWDETEGYFLCFSQDNHPLVAQVNVDGGHQLIDPKNMEKTPLNEATAENLKKNGYVFYRNFPEKKSLSWDDLTRFMLFKRGREVRIILLCGFLAVLMGLFIPYATHVIFEQVIPTLDSSLLLQISLAMFISVISSALFQLAKEYTITRMISLVDVQLMAAVWDRTLSLKSPFFKKYEVGDLYMRIQGFSEMAQMIAGNPLRVLLNALFALLYLISMFYYSPQLTLIALGIIGAVALITLTFIIKNIPIQKKIMDIKGFTYSKVIEIIQAITKVRTSGVTNRMFSYWLQNFSRAKKLEKWQLKNQNIISTVLFFAPHFAYFLILAVIIYHLTYLQGSIQSAITVGSLMAFLAAYTPFTESLFEAMQTLVSLQMLKPLWDRARVVLEEPLEFESSKAKLSTVTGSIRLEHVSFRYAPDTPFVLKDVSFEIKPGEFVGIVGYSGAGKSTVIRLITGLEATEQGEIFIDNHSLKNIDLQDFRRQISTVLQQGFILTGSLREFLSSGRHYSDEKLLFALSQAGFTEDLNMLPMGLNTVLVNGAATFSGGQRQRLILAKALVSDPKILLLDEATSALDNQTQELVKRNLDRQLITRIVVAHRLSTVRLADRILVLDNGVIADQGTFDELSKKKGLFAELLAKQQG